ncbi:hypothetical protein [Burkholderia sp. 9779_493]|uniref:hypothetical protein n=1 Tax=Burkholderia sp. 9779_493 TaxID=2751184 RepID=UPI000ACA40E1|nr:hypothetical protein [Burkholderia sp. 9779_493]PZW99767.1 hypothetical protein DFS13_110189 [Burkholderia sp. 28_3]RAS52614.1 hypothetical protein DFS07_109189 [Burkholderia cenocepacia]CAB5080939.1 hypothetical protein IST4116A_04713 [Burkholderia cenocepacia]CAB5084300.1 hypothetical protein IST4113_04743 [Burkholderia cenocepacia]CAB5084666.1 hypothetical protein IST4110_04733 [Burkholderia cenocepacia]
MIDQWCHYWHHRLRQANGRILDQMTRKPAKVRFIDLFEISQVLDAIDRLKEQKS